ncbi:WD repeat-containing protein 86-like [Portunus trituberculatus]|uniref:WD repeat-containing protein 86-like n=1 Tax=Portunus trituberculatus TaxID=210409 RepID=UPI001E1CEEF9|nr:WD repeat-containing protein 86-like [Portunus trituberculatus]
MGSGISKSGAEGVPLDTIKAHTDCINCMALSEDASLLVTGSDDTTAKMWSTKTDCVEDLGTLEGHQSFIQCVTIYDTYVITGSKDATLKLWDMGTMECLFTYEGHTNRINRLICTGEFIFSTSHDKTARAWLFDTQDVEDPSDACIRTFEGHTSVVSPIIFVPGTSIGIPDEKGMNINPTDKVVTGSFDNTARVWSFDTGICLKVLKGHRMPITCMDTDPKGTILYTAGQDKAIIAWDIARGHIMKRVDDAHAGAILHLRVVNRLAYTCSTDYTAKCWVREGLENTRTYKEHTDSVITARFHNGILYTASNDGLVRAFDAKSGALKRKFKGHDSGVTCMVVCVKEQEGEVFTWIVSGGNDNTIKVWNATGLSEEFPDVPQPSHEYDFTQDERLDDLDRRLDDYLPNSPPPDDESLEILDS